MVDMRNSMTPYEKNALKELHAWQAEPPGWGARLLAKPGGKVAEIVQTVVPIRALRAALEGADALARKLSDQRSILKRAKVATLAELREQPLEHCDRIALSTSRRALALGGATGAVFGVAGAAGLVADIPTLLTLAFRTIHRIGMCYGEELPQDSARRLGIAIFALTSANSIEEKQAALQALNADGDTAQAAWRDGVERVTERELAKEAAIFSLQNLARSIGLNLGKRKVAGSVPVIGAVVGGAVNAWYLNDTARTARYVFQERWLASRGSGRLVLSQTDLKV